MPKNVGREIESNGEVKNHYCELHSEHSGLSPIPYGTANCNVN